MLRCPCRMRKEVPETLNLSPSPTCPLRRRGLGSAARGLSTVVTWDPDGGAGWGGSAWRGGHVVGSSARASLSDLYGSADSLEQRSARRGACPRAPGSRRCRPSRSAAGLQFHGVFVFLSPPAEGHGISPKGTEERGAWGLPGCAWVFGSRRRSRCPPLQEAPRAFSRAESRPRARVCGARRPWAPAAAQPPPRGGEGRGRHLPETWRERGRDGSELATGEARERCSLPHLMVPVPQASAALLPPVSCCGAAWGPASPRAGGGSGCLRTFSLTRALGYIEEPGSASPGRRRREDAGSSRAAGRPSGAALGGVCRRGAAGKSKGAGPAAAAAEGRRRSAGVASLASAWSGASPTPWPWLR
ncbi:uncharacterized protein LOC122427821 [Cervus canadensis]|uniref:uncharacterized protein LOC122427821 n=1 Tax=Cervus canadensis TaxID=1574408 RepID=UPI001CA307C6|nr:uncharacterized protein LOC122427821 [Cervus canadensis]